MRGEVCLCPIKYEKLPLICFYCGKLGHGSNECKEVFGESSPVKNYGMWMKASPWRPMKNSDTIEEGDRDKKCSRKLFFPKKLSTKEPPANEVINSVTSLLGNFDLNQKNVRENTEDEVFLSEGPANCLIKINEVRDSTQNEAMRNVDDEVTRNTNVGLEIVHEPLGSTT